MKKFSRIFTYIAQHKVRLTSYLVFSFLSIVFGIVSLAMLFPFLQVLFKTEPLTTTAPGSGFSPIAHLKNFLTNLLTGFEPVQALVWVCGLIIVTIILKNITVYLASRSIIPMKNAVSNDFRKDIFAKVLQLPIGFFTEQRKGDIMSRMTNDVNEVEGSIIGTLEGLIKNPLQIIINVVVLFTMSVKLTAFILLFIPVMGFVIGRISRTLKKHSERAAHKQGQSISLLDETLGGLRIIKAFNAEKFIRSKFFSLSDSLLKERNRISARQDLSSPITEILGVMIFTTILWFGGTQVLKGTIDMDGAMFLAYMALFFNIIEPAKSLSGAFNSINKGTVALNRINDILEAPVIISDNRTGKKATGFHDSIKFENVDFGYNDLPPVLKNINLEIGRGKMIALVGSSGAGKSTLADLIPRFHDVKNGEITVDGINIKDYNLPSLRSLMSIVTQEPILFNDTIANNIALGKPDATREEIMEAAKIANAYDFIMKKEQGFDTNIGDRGTKLSGGERQRLTIARAVLNNPPILILDEATSSLDTESERLVQDAINNLMENRTSIVIAHRLSTVRNADEIIVLQNGQIVERGTHRELVIKNGFYNKLVQMQEVA